MNLPLNPPVVERYDGIDVVREDLCCPDLPSGKLRGVLPWFRDLAESGRKRVANYATSHSNSHAIISYAAKVVGLEAITYTCCTKPTPQTLKAEGYGGKVVYAGPMHLSPLKNYAAKAVKELQDCEVLPWALMHPAPALYVAGVAAWVNVRGEPYDYHVVPMGGGGYAYGVAMGGRHCERRPLVVAVPATGTVEHNYKRFNQIRPPTNVLIQPRPPHQIETPFPSDPMYEHWAWPVALDLAARGQRVCFWSVGVPLF